MQITRKLDVNQLPNFKSKFESLNRRCKKLSLAPLTYNVGPWIADESTGDVYADVTITGEPPQVPGYVPVAKLSRMDEGDNLVQAFPGMDGQTPVEYRHHDLSCDHCRAKRSRKDVFLLRDADGQHFVVGRQCLKDFLNIDAETLANQLLLWTEVGEMGIRDFGDGVVREYISLRHYMSHVAAVIRSEGWVSRTKAREEEGLISTAYLAMNSASTPPGHPMHFNVEEMDTDLADKVIEWVRSLSESERANDYMYNLYVTMRRDIVDRKTSGIAASAIPAYQRHLDRLAEQDARQKADQAIDYRHVGEIGVRSVFSGLRLIRCMGYESDYGVRTLCLFEDADHNRLTWWASGEPQWVYDLRDDDVITIKATVKDHTEYKEKPQTLLSRVALVESTTTVESAK